MPLKRYFKSDNWLYLDTTKKVYVLLIISSIISMLSSIQTFKTLLTLSEYYEVSLLKLPSINLE